MSLHPRLRGDRLGYPEKSAAKPRTLWTPDYMAFALAKASGVTLSEDKIVKLLI
jgi:hypothetical protein